jgi:hypothetical protein
VDTAPGKQAILASRIRIAIRGVFMEKMKRRLSGDVVGVEEGK